MPQYGQEGPWTTIQPFEAPQSAAAMHSAFVLEHLNSVLNKDLRCTDGKGQSLAGEEILPLIKKTCQNV
jgi:hypothetical protein